MPEKPTYEELSHRVLELENEIETRTDDFKKINEKLRQEIYRRKRSQEALLESETQFRLLFETMVSGFSLLEMIYDADLKPIDCRYVTVNPSHRRQSGLDPAKIIGKTAKEVFGLKDEWIARYGQVDQTGQPAIVEDYAEGLDRWFRVVAYRPKPGFVAVIFDDITDQKRMEREIRKSEEKYRFLVENATDAIFIAQDEVIKFPNPIAEKLTGYTAEELEKKSFADLIHPEDKKMVLDRHLRRLSGETLPATYDFRIINNRGEQLWVQINTVLISWDERPATLNFIRDITQQKKLETQLIHAQKMESIGTLAGGIAHDFNNLLMGMQGHISLMLIGKDASHQDFEHLKGVEERIENAADLTRQLLGFARGGQYEVKPTDLNDLIQKSIDLFGPTRKEITIHKKSQKAIWTVEADQKQIEQVLLNLYINAWQAMSGTGELFLATENVILDEKYVKPFGLGAGRYVKISVTDTGIGMDKATQQRIFDPFFTTKEMGRGIGMGLASAYGIIRNHSGIINVYSEKGKGATFNIYLPAADAEDITPGKENQRPDEILRGTETVLLVDDEEIIIEVGQELLEALGYQVISVRSGREALEVYQKKGDMIDMVILDMIMPQMGGGETYDRLKEADPDILVLLSSGYSINGPAKEILGRGCNGFIQKPFSLKDLSRKLRDILDTK
ncbi:MAG: PAS domain S-box protein [Desulfobacterales bacterium]